MNFISHKSALSLYPSATFIKQRSYLLPMTPRSWKAAPSHPYVRTQALTEGGGLLMRSRPSYGADEACDLGIDVERHIDDERCWKLRFDNEGRILDEMGTQEAAHAQQRMRRSTWVMKFNRNSLKIHVTSTDLDLFPYA